MKAKPSLNVSLTPEWQKYVEQKLKTGLYATAAEVMREALRLMRERDQLQELRLEQVRRDIEHGYRQAERGELVDGEKVFARLLKKKGQRRRKSKRA